MTQRKKTVWEYTCMVRVAASKNNADKRFCKYDDQRGSYRQCQAPPNIASALIGEMVDGLHRQLGCVLETRGMNENTHHRASFHASIASTRLITRRMQDMCKTRQGEITRTSDFENTKINEVPAVAKCNTRLVYWLMGWSRNLEGNYLEFQ